ncbi:hypothetical protein NUU61_001906 [Penicillium alfredii]|uniref:DNA2/NAM7 helicase-like C-terminal domain-containing protein n=1 Tax=Penicillium alfredii TaxID=1506179 RepID=A0A9W9FQI9_9EURO|nr:uncharacterized protein NUU61_001906 [Penicillium alfredii]KAJ5104559.1 hypothetical protein NUU61_001906 [Penicillium alfredii]
MGNWSRDSTILQGAKVVGMTTTGLSKYRGLVASLNPQVVVIEETAQAIETPVTCAVHELAGPPFHLDISMFERLITNNMTFTKLQEQRRMAPEIRALLTPIYGNLLDHRSVHKRPPVSGMGDVRLFFMTHNFLEDNENLASKFNEFEASMVTEFYAYLVMNGISDRKITILTFYQGQKKKILKMVKTHQHLTRSFVNVATVDSYQGDENGIILLSLVRSHA